MSKLLKICDGNEAAAPHRPPSACIHKCYFSTLNRDVNVLTKIFIEFLRKIQL